MMAIRYMVLVVTLLVGLNPSATADVITDWNERAVAAGYTARISPGASARNIAMVHVAMFEAVNSIEPRYSPYRARLPVEPGASLDAAAAAAAHYLLARMYPDQAKEMEKAFQTSLGAVADGPPKMEGIQLGEQAAIAILAERSTDGADAPNTYRPFTIPGRYVPTSLPVMSSWGAVRPFALKTSSQFRPVAPYALTSMQWAKDYNEVKRMGAKVSSGRTAEQTEIARFWALVGPATYNPIARQLSAANKLGVLENARLFALFSMAASDAGTAIFEAKYKYNFWRPVTAIRNGDLDGNKSTERDSSWEPFIETPMHPEYPCAHCTFQSTAAGVLEAFFGDQVPTFRLTSTTAPGVTRTFSKLSDYVAEVVNARVYDGVHYRRSGDAGVAMGRKIGQYTVENYLKPPVQSAAR
ncbi:MAG TPA: vanadium-dependent haloperoxidase [Candidatus Binatia bacterium]|nr:vanadium-dependent haloperoxidase [Candidatus Binatia bacterium]